MSIAFGYKIQDYYESGQIKKSDIDTLREFLKNENMPFESDEMIGVFVRACGGNIEDAKKYGSVHYRGRKLIPEIFGNRQLSDNLKRQWNVIEIAVMPNRTDEGFAVIILRLQDPVASHWHMDLSCKLLLMCVDSILYDEPVTGFLVIVDLEKMGPMHILTRLKLSILKKMLKNVDEGLLHLLKGVHYINGGFVFDQLFKLFKMMCKPELLNLFLYHPTHMDWDEFYKNHVAKKCLPSDYGGDDEPVSVIHKKMWKKLEDLELFYDQEAKAREIFEQTK